MVSQTPESTSEGLEVKPLIKELVSKLEKTLGPDYEVEYYEKRLRGKYECVIHIVRWGLPEGGVFWFEDTKREIVSELTFVDTAYMPATISEKIEKIVEEVNKHLVSKVVEDE
jgi:hypothetical protein